MATISTPALILHVIPYGDTSKILKLLTRDQGLISVIARGARRNRSRTGPRLDLFTTGVASVVMKQQRDLQLLTAFEAEEVRGALGRDVGRFAAAAALAEIALRCSSHDTSPDVFDAARAGLTVIADADPGWAATGALVACWGLVAALGFTPVLDRCVVCDEAMDDTLHFSAAQGGAVCARHRGGGAVSNLSGPDREALVGLTAGRMPAVALDVRHAAAHRRLLLGFVRYHLAEQRTMPALAFWDSESWNDT